MFEIKLIFLRSQSYVAIFSICMAGKILGYVFNNFLLIDATDRSKISRDQKRLFIALSLYPLSVFANTPFKLAFFCKILYWTKISTITIGNNLECVKTDPKKMPIAHPYWRGPSEPILKMPIPTGGVPLKRVDKLHLMSVSWLVWTK